MVRIDVVRYAGWDNNLRLTNGAVELIVTLDVGPRILSYRLAGGANVLKECADQLGKKGEPDWQVRGGHRLWTSPEDLTRTYSPDNGPVSHQELAPGLVRVSQPPDEFGIRKEIDIRLDRHGSRVQLLHRITNVSPGSARLAPWALTVMAPGGLEIIPLPPKRPHPGPPSNARSPADYAPNQELVLWPFFDFADPRWTFGSRYITLRQDPTRGPTKIGLSHRQVWVAYQNAGTLFVKHTRRRAGRRYPDRGCNLETFANEDMLEIESLGPLVEVAGGESTELAETWELHPLPAEIRTEDDIDRHVLPLVRGRG